MSAVEGSVVEASPMEVDSPVKVVREAVEKVVVEVAVNTTEVAAARTELLSVVVVARICSRHRRQHSPRSRDSRQDNPFSQSP